MSDLSFPVLRLELQDMKYSLLHALQDRHQDLEKMISASFDKAVEHIQVQLDAQVQKALATVINDAVTQAAELAAEGLADELAEAMAGRVREIVHQRMMNPTQDTL